MQGWKNALILMRIPFSVYLMPIFWFAISSMETTAWPRLLLIFSIIHLGVYPASNGYNSYFDRDEDSIGGLKHPPKASKELFWLVVLFDLLSVGFSCLVSLEFAFGIGLYILVSKAYSHDRIRLKKYPYLSTLVVTFFQGAYTFCLVQYGMGMSWESMMEPNNVRLAIVSSLFLCGSYPLTQIYQHAADRERGDLTLSLKLGVWGTFMFAGIAMLLATSLLLWTFWLQDQGLRILIFLGAGAPVVWVLGRWAWKIYQGLEVLDFEHSMRMNQVSSFALSAAFILMWGLRGC